MIKVEVLDTQDGKRVIFFQGTKEEDKENLDKVLEALVGPFPRRGSYVVGAPTDVLSVEVNLTK